MGRFLLTNSTDIRMGDIRRFISKCLDNELEDRTIILGFEYNKNKDVEGIWGYSFEGVPTICIVLPVRWRSNPCNVQGVAQVMLHELGHTYGLDEHEIPPLDHLDTRWAEGLHLRRRKR